MAVTVSPASAPLFLGQTQTFTATLTGTTNTAVTWTVNAIPGGNSTVGTISTAGLYAAPQILPSPATVTITATSVASPSSSGSASAKILSDIQVGISPTGVTVAVGATEPFSAVVTGSGSPSTVVTWGVSGTGCSGATCGTISSTGNDTALYTAAASIPSPPVISVTATSVADPSKSASASVTITAACSPPISISPSAASVDLGRQQTFTATVCFSTNQAVNWTLSGAGCSGAACGTVSATGLNSAVYTAPASLPPANPVTLTATSQADPAQSAATTVTLVSAVAVALSPSFASVAINHRQAFSASVANTTNQAVTWAVNGIVNGNSALGQICLAGSNPCAPPPGPNAGSVDYLAPASVPASNPVTITATSAADPAHSASAEVNILPHVQVVVAPAYAFIGPLGDAELTATVAGSSNQAVTWTVSCSASQCGSVTSSGLFMAPATAPSPNVIYVTATSQDDPTQSASAAVALSSSLLIEVLAPSSVTAGLAESFTLAVGGVNFTPSSPGPGSTLLFNGVPRGTSCASSLACTVTIDPADAAAAASPTIQLQNPDGTLSNPVRLVVVPPDNGQGVISLTASLPTAGGKDIIAVESTFAPPPSIAFLALLDSTGTTCELLGGSITLPRPASGSATFNLCLGGFNLNPSSSFIVTGPAPNDITISSSQPSGSITALSVTLSSTTQPGGRTLFVTDPNLNRAAASSAIVVQ